MKVVILAGGKGLRIRDVDAAVPKPLILLKGEPIITHIMRHYAKFGFTDFILLGGYRVDKLKSYFDNLNDPIINTWNVKILDSKLETNTGGRLLWLEEELMPEETFLLTYGDGLSDVNIRELIELHINSGMLVTLTTVNPRSNYGIIDISDDSIVLSMREKPVLSNMWINAGFMCVSKQILGLIESEDTSLEIDILGKLVTSGQLGAYKHYGFWQSIDTKKDIELLESLNDLGT
jgi:glucose-1-phosphate cytidylyltransferase